MMRWQMVNFVTRSVQYILFSNRITSTYTIEYLCKSKFGTGINSFVNPVFVVEVSQKKNAIIFVNLVVVTSTTISA